MAMLPQSARTAAAYLGGGIARGVEKTGAQIAQVGTKAVEQAKSPIGQKVGQFLQDLGGQAKQFGSSVGTQGAIGKRDVGLAAAGAAMTGAFVGGMGANSGVHALMGYEMSNPLTRVQAEQPTLGGNPMPADLQTGYIAMNQLGSPLGLQMLRQNLDVKTAQTRQRTLRAAVLGMMGGDGVED